jgi:alanyl-tRNA synthetase
MAIHGTTAQGVPVGLVLDTTSFYAESGGQVGTASLFYDVCVGF